MLTALTVVSLGATVYVRPGLIHNFESHRIWLVVPLSAFASLAAMPSLAGRERELEAFLCSSVYLVAMLAGAAAGLYPTLLPDISDPALNITIFSAAAGQGALSYGLIWWSGGMVIALGYFVFLYRMFRGKVKAASV